VDLKAAFRKQLFIWCADILKIISESYVNQLGIVRQLITPHTLSVFVRPLPRFLSARNGLWIS